MYEIPKLINNINLSWSESILSVYLDIKISYIDTPQNETKMKLIVILLRELIFIAHNDHKFTYHRWMQ